MMGLGYPMKRNFAGVLLIDPPLNSGTLSYRFTATAPDGVFLHSEIVGLGRNGAGVLEIVHMSNNYPGLQHFQLVDARRAELTMLHGNLDDLQSFREIVRMRFSGEREVRLSYDWAMPGQAMTPQSWAELVKVVA